MTYIRLPAVKQMIGVSATSTIYGWIADGRFPRPVKLSARVAAWDLEAIEKWMADVRSGKTAA